jgi:hypothetical protein
MRDHAPHPETAGTSTAKENVGAGDRTEASPLSPAEALRLQRLIGNAAVRRVLMRPRGQRDDTGMRLLMDEPVPSGSGTMAVADFLDVVEEQLVATADSALAETPWRSAGCPYIKAWVAHYRGVSGREVEQVVRDIIGDAGGITDPVGYVSRLRGIVRDGVTQWVEGGALPVVPAAVREASPAVTASEPDTAQTGADPRTRARAVGPASGSGGHPLDTATRTRMEGALGAPLGSVRIRTDRSTVDAGTRAVTRGEHIAFAPDAYRPGTPHGDVLLAHELAHVIQQRGSPPGTSADEPEVEADANRAATLGVLRLWNGRGLSQLRNEAGPRLKSGVRASRCAGPAPEPADPRPRYEEIVERLRVLYRRKRAVLEGTGAASELPEITAAIDALVAQLNEMGVRLGPDEIYKAVGEQEEGTRDLLQIRGRVIRSPPGPARWAQRTTFTLDLDYAPAGRTIEVAWRWRAGGSRWYQFFGAPGRGPSTSVSLDGLFWQAAEGNEIADQQGFEVEARVYLGDESALRTAPRLTVELADELPEVLQVRPTPAVALVEERIRFDLGDFVPIRSRHAVDWYVDGTRVTEDLPQTTHGFEATGRYRVTAKLYEAKRRFGLTRGPLLRQASTTLEVQDPDEIAAGLLDEVRPGSLPQLGELETSIRESIGQLERRVAWGGEQRDYWADRLDKQRDRLRRLREEAPTAGADAELPADDLGPLETARSYSRPIPAVMVTGGGGGAQPLIIHLRVWHTEGRWHAKLLDSTGADVYRFEGEGSSALAASQAAVRDWRSDHPYPRGGTVRYRFSPDGWSEPTTFETTTAWNTAKAWIDGVLAVGGVVVAGLLLLTPEPSGATKALGYILLTASVARSAVAIAENLDIGIPALDSRNVLEGVSIVTSLVGVSGTALRGVGLRAVRPTTYRVGNWTVMTALAGDVGTLAFVTSEALDQLRAARADPTLDEGQRAVATLRIMSGLLAQGALFFVSNKDLMRQGIRRSDFLATNAPHVGQRARSQLGRVDLEPGARLDIGAELRAAGEPDLAARMRAGQVTDRDLVDRHGALPWLRESLDAAGVRSMLERLETRSLIALQDIPSSRARAAVDALGDSVSNVAAPSLRGVGLARLSTEVQATGSRVVSSPTEAGILVLNPRMTDNTPVAGTGLEIHPGRLAEIPDRDFRELLDLTEELTRTGSLPPARRQRLDTLTGTSQGHRLRMEHHRQAGEDFLTRTLGVPASTFPEPLSRLDRERLFDLANENVPEPIRSQAKAYALAQSPPNARLFVEHFQVYREDAESRVKAWLYRVTIEVDRLNTADVAAGRTPDSNRNRVHALHNLIPAAERPAGFPRVGEVRNKKSVREILRDRVGRDMAGQPLGGRADSAGALSAPSATTTTAVQSAYEQRVAALGTRARPTTIDASLPNDALEAAVKRTAGSIGFGSESAGAYHVQKHFFELPAAERAVATQPGASDVVAYLRSIDRTLAHPDRVRLEFGQYGSRRLVFERDRLRLIVIVTPNGQTMIATYGAGPR